MCLRHQGEPQLIYLLGGRPDEEKGLAMYTGLTPKICKTAWEICLPSLVVAAERGITNRLGGTIVVLDPRNGEPLFSAVANPHHSDRYKFDDIAQAKARVSWNTGLSSRQVQQDAPHLYLPGMTKWGGSVTENKLVVAFSGVQAVFDEAIARMMLNWILALCQNEMTKPDGVMASSSSYVGGDPS